MDKPVLRTGIIGSGFAGRFHYEALKHVFCVTVQVVGVYSPTQQHREAFAQERGINAYDSVDALIDDADILHVCSPPSSHEDLAIRSLVKDKHVIVEKPLTGYFGDGGPDFDGMTFPRVVGLKAAVESVKRMRAAEARSRGTIFYAENLVYAPAIQKEREIIEKTKDQILWMYAETSHNGSASKYYGVWSYSGGGSLVGKGVHPLSAAIYLKYVEGRAVRGKPIRPVTVSARTHAVTRSPKYRGSDFIRRDYKDIEDYGSMHVVFEDDTFADILCSELVLGGVKSYLEACATGHRTLCNMNPNTAMQTYTPKGDHFKDIYTVEKISSKEGWTCTSPDEAWFYGFQHETEAFYQNAVTGRRPESDSMLAGDTIATVYAAYLSAEQLGKAVEIPRLDET